MVLWLMRDFMRNVSQILKMNAFAGASVLPEAHEVNLREILQIEMLSPQIVSLPTVVRMNKLVAVVYCDLIFRSRSFCC